MGDTWDRIDDILKARLEVFQAKREVCRVENRFTSMMAWDMLVEEMKSLREQFQFLREEE